MTDAQIERHNMEKDLILSIIESLLETFTVQQVLHAISVALIKQSLRIKPMSKIALDCKNDLFGASIEVSKAARKIPYTLS